MALPQSVHERRLDKYVIRHKLGEGGMGEVWLAHDPVLARDVAIKVLQPTRESDQQVVHRFMREAQIAARLKHPNTVEVYDVREAEGQVYIVMELMEGGSLAAEVHERGALPWRQAAQAIRDAAAGLQAAHESGLVHRDVKPSNLMRSARGVVKVVDFGLAHAPSSDSQLTQSGAILGSPAYMSPEQCRGELADARSDLYSLSCTFYTLLTRQPPFVADNAMAMMHLHLTAPLPDPRPVAGPLPDAVCRLLARGGGKSPGERYQTAREMIAELDALLATPDKSNTWGTDWKVIKSTLDPAEAHAGVHAPAQPAAHVVGRGQHAPASPRAAATSTASEFRITISPGSPAGGYPLVIRGPSMFGEPSGVLRIDSADPSIQSALVALADGRCSEPALQEFGDRLFQSLLPGPLATSFELSRTQAQAMGGALRVTLQVLDEELRWLPWELLYHHIHRSWFSTSPQTPVSRFVDALATPPLAVDPPLRLLLCVAEPVDWPSAAAGSELAALKVPLTKLTSAGMLKVTLLEHTTRESLRLSLERVRPHLLHFIGHGQRMAQESGLVLEREDRTSDLVPSLLLCELLRRTGTIRAAVLSACETDRLAYALAQEGLASVGMRYAVRNQAAVQFFRAFYQAVTSGTPADQAVNAARFALRLECGAERNDWCSPVVFLPGGEPRLFEFAHPVNELITAPKSMLVPVSVTSTPPRGAIRVDGRETGKLTPDVVAIDPSRTHLITVARDGYQPARPQPAGGSTPASGTIELHFAMEPLRGSLVIHTACPGAAMAAVCNETLQRQDLGPTDDSGILGPVSLPAGSYRIEATFAADSDTGPKKMMARSPTVQVQAEQTAQVRLKLPESARGISTPTPKPAARRSRAAMWIVGGSALAMLLLVGVIFVVIRYGSGSLPQSTPSAQPTTNQAGMGGDMVLVPAGTLYRGLWDTSVSPEEAPILQVVRKYRRVVNDVSIFYRDQPAQVQMKSFRIDRHEVTNAEYRRFLDQLRDHRFCHPEEPAGKEHTPAAESWKDARFSQANQPVVGVDWFDAYAYARWAGKRLPGGDEWEYAARGGTKWLYPWGDLFDPTKCVCRESSASAPAAVASMSEGASPLGVLHMADNVREWTMEADASGSGGGSGADTWRVVRGGAWGDLCEVQGLLHLRGVSAARTHRSILIGFRCVADAR